MTYHHKSLLQVISFISAVIIVAFVLLGMIFGFGVILKFMILGIIVAFCIDIVIWSSSASA